MIKLPQHRLAFQLTPLLDLLLIVIFAQYLEVRENTRSQPEQPSAPNTAQVEAQIQSLEQEAKQLQSRLARTDEHQRQVGDVIAELFQVDQKLIEEVFQAGKPELQPHSQKDVDLLKKQMQKLSKLRGNEVIKHLLTYHELLKRADTWQVYVSEHGTSHVQMGTEKFRFEAAGAEDFSRRFFQRYKSIAEPKGLVFILFYHGNAKAGSIQIAWEGLQQSIDKMRVDRNFRTQFEYANVGYLPSVQNEQEEVKYE